LSKAAVALRKAGTYVFELTVKDTVGVEKTAEVTVVVEAMTKNITVPAINTAANPMDFDTVTSLVSCRLGH
jgi:hypothetical protein